MQTRLFLHHTGSFQSGQRNLCVPEVSLGKSPLVEHAFICYDSSNTSALKGSEILAGLSGAPYFLFSVRQCSKPPGMRAGPAAGLVTTSRLPPPPISLPIS